MFRDNNKHEVSLTPSQQGWDGGMLGGWQQPQEALNNPKKLPKVLTKAAPGEELEGNPPGSK
jgi:hypothetical protein